MAKFILNPDKAYRKDILAQIAEKKRLFGKPYCPCVPVYAHSDATVCQCEEFRKNGRCHCLLYVPAPEGTPEKDIIEAGREAHLLHGRMLFS